MRSLLYSGEAFRSVRPGMTDARFFFLPREAHHELPLPSLVPSPWGPHCGVSGEDKGMHSETDYSLPAREHRGIQLHIGKELQDGAVPRSPV
jgi:hypothetical protein